MGQLLPDVALGVCLGLAYLGITSWVPDLISLLVAV